MKDKSILFKRITTILGASLLSAFAINIFYIPHKLLNGGVGGMSLIIQYITGIGAGYFIILFNIPLFILSYKKVNREFTLLTIVGTLSQSIFLIITKDISHYFAIKDVLLSCIYGGVLQGLALGIVFTNHGSLGGADIITMIVRKKYELDLGKISFGINLVIVSVGSYFFGIESGLYTLIAMYVSSDVLDKVIKGLDRKKIILIISQKEEEIANRINDELNRGTTILYGEGFFTRSSKNVIYCAVSLTQVPRVRSIIQEIDPYSFTTILDASEVQGKGFKRVL